METKAAVEEKIEEQVEDQVEKKRGVLLTIFLVLMFIVNPITAFTYFTKTEMIIELTPSLSVGILYFLGVIAMANVALAAGVWMWKKWAVFSFYAVGVIAFCTNSFIGIEIIPSLIGLIGPVIIYFTTKKRWEHFS